MARVRAEKYTSVSVVVVVLVMAALTGNAVAESELVPAKDAPTLGSTALAYADSIAAPGTQEHARIAARLLALLGQHATANEENARGGEVIPADLPPPVDVSDALNSLPAKQASALNALISLLPQENRATFVSGAAGLASPGMIQDLKGQHSGLNAADIYAVATLTNISELPETRIYFGARSRLPFVGALLGENGQLVCSATLVAPDKILTAAHCLCDRDSLGAIREPTLVSFGSNTSSARRALLQLSQPRRVLSTAACDDALPFRLSTWSNGDLAVVALNKALPWSGPILRFGTDAEMQLRRSVDIVGFGETHLNVKKWQNATRLSVVSFGCEGTVTSEYGCAAPTAGGPLEGVAQDIDPTHRNKQDACFGDSGGPVFLSDASESSGEHILIGVISRKIPNKKCGDGTVFGRIDGGLYSWFLMALTNL